jgi:hypothetical protein
MSSWLNKHGFDRYKLVGTAIAALLTMGFAVIVKPVLILAMEVHFYSLVTFLIGAPLGYLAQHSSDKIVSAMCGGYMEANHGTSVILDALRTLIFAAVETGTCVLIIIILMVLPK